MELDDVLIQLMHFFLPEINVRIHRENKSNGLFLDNADVATAFNVARFHLRKLVGSLLA